MVFPLIAAAGQALGQAANKVVSGAGQSTTDPGQTGTTVSENAQSLVAPQATQAETLNTAQNLTPVTAQAQEATQQAGQETKQAAVQGGNQIQQQAQQPINVMQQQQQQAANEYQRTLADTHQATINAENVLNDTVAAATIKPQQYVENLGVSGKAITALGMLISGAGSGLTGQPNLAMEAFQKNVDRDINAQQQKFLNNYHVLAANQGFVATQSQRAAINAAASAAAAVSVYSGLQTVAQGISLKIQGIQAPAQAGMITQDLQAKKAQALNNFNQLYGSTVSAHDSQQTSMLGWAMKAIAGSIGFNMVPQSANSKIQQTQQNNPAYQNGPISSQQAQSIQDIVGASQEGGVPLPKASIYDKMAEKAGGQ